MSRDATVRIETELSRDAIELIDTFRAHGLPAELAETPGAWDVEVTVRPDSPDAFTELRPPLSEQEALLAADLCLECAGLAQAPCVAACPAGVDVPGFVGAIARGDLAGAAQTIFAENFLGGTCARVCPAEVLCEGACVLEHEGRPPVQIAALQRYATDWAFAERILPRRPATATGHRVAVIGAGPAGLACAGELASRGHAVTIFDEREEIGGLVRYAIAPYRQQLEPLPDELAALEALGVELRLGVAIDSREALDAIAAEAEAVFVGVGMGPDVDVGYTGDELPGVWESLRFVEALKTGRPPEVGRRVAVIGGGNTAMDMACEALRLGAEHVTVLYRRTEAEMPAYPHEVEEARREGARFEWLVSPLRFLGTEHVEGVECRRMELGAPDESGRRRPEPVPGTEFVVPADTVVKAIGQRPRAEFLGWIEGLELDRGLVSVDPETGQTGNPKFFAAGDATNGGATAVEAVRGAKLAARAIDERLGRFAVTEIRWHARAGQGAKTASQLLALALLRSGKSVQAFPEYGPERRGAPLRAYTRADDRPIRRHDAVTHPDVVVVLEPSLLGEVDVTEGLAPDGFVLVNGERAPDGLDGRRVVCVPASQLADSNFVNVVMLGALAAALGDPPLAELQHAAVEVLGKKVPAEALRSALRRATHA